MVAYVYLLEEVPHSGSDSGPWTKIGCSKNPPEWRIGANLKRGNPRNLHLAAVYQFEAERDAFDAEGRAHQHFQQFAHQKEWFQIRASEVSAWAEKAAGWHPRSNQDTTLANAKA